MFTPSVLLISIVLVWLNPVLAIVVSLAGFALAPGRRWPQLALPAVAIVAAGWLAISLDVRGRADAGGRPSVIAAPTSSGR